jgi:hypothetical protein
VKRAGLYTAAVAAALWASPALAGAYRIVLTPPAGGKLLHGHGGVEAADDRTDVALVRLVSPGNDIHERGTVRVLVMNLGTKPFDFGPDDVTLSLADGTILKPVPVDQMEDGRELVEREMRQYAARDLQNRNNLSGLSQQANGGMAIPPTARGVNTSGRPATVTGHDYRTDEMLLPGMMMLDSIYQILIPLTVEPQKAWGGYYVFDFPRAAFRRKADQPLTILVRTGAEQHRFAATLKWK